MGIEVETIRPGVVGMLRVNLGIQAGESVLVVTDVPTPEQWGEWAVSQLEEVSQRAALARQVAEIAAEELPACVVGFLAYPATGRSGSEPGDEVAARLREVNVVVAITSFSLSHTRAREDACRAGARVASMPRFLPEMFYRDGPLAVDYRRIAQETARIAACLTGARVATVRSPAGTDLEFGLEGREGRVDDGLYLRPGTWGNLPGGEAYIAPVEGTAEGVLVVEPEWHHRLVEPMRLVFSCGAVVAVDGGGEVGERLRDLLGLGGRQPTAEERARRHLAELGVGTNPNARRTDITLEAEKIKGTVHVAIGDNSHMGGANVADYHADFVVPRATLLLDGQTVMDEGRWTFG
ncbi:aminopeptidase [Candidatus Bipolaricaulota bacterium]|nr:aminopeptidase [Candidatus Bipolaricaulota bacterium]